MSTTRKWYAYGDELLEELRVKTNRTFSRSRLLMNFDEINAPDVLREAERVYTKLRRMNKKYFEPLADYVYYMALYESGATKADAERMRDTFDTAAFVDEQLMRYNPVTKYVYAHEAERKQARFAESLIADIENTNIREIERDYSTANRLWNNQTAQYMIDIEDATTVQAYKDRGVERVMWVTKDDERVCGECDDMDGMIFEINHVPPKPHPRCRCTIVPVN